MKVKKLKTSFLNFDDNLISKNALAVVKTLKTNGYQAFLVGGCVRDLLISVTPKDFDVATNATPNKIKRIFKNCRLIGRRFRLAHIRYGREIIEVSTFRSASMPSNKNVMMDHTGRIIRDNEFGSVEEDAIRRDFRCNALYYDPAKKKIWDFMDGLDDIQQKKLVVIGLPDNRIQEDPVRMIRALRFSAKLNFSLDKNLKKSIQRNSDLLCNVPSARIFEEFKKLFLHGNAEKVFLLMQEYNIFNKIFFDTYKEIKQDKIFNNFIIYALQDSDRRVLLGQPVSPMFLLGVFFWASIKRESLKIKKRKKCSDARSIVLAAITVIDAHKRKISIPKRFSSLMIDMLSMQPRLEIATKKNAKYLISQRAFRAAYDFMLIRTKVNEFDEEIASFWISTQSE